MEWNEYSFLTVNTCVDAIAGILHGLGSGGVVIEDPASAGQRDIEDKTTPDTVPPHSEYVIVKAYFPADKPIMDELAEAIKLVENNFGVKCKIVVNEISNEDWEETWKEYYHTFKIGTKLIIKPSWEDYTPQENEAVINIDPGMAFGTGLHASTRFCLRFIDQYVKGGERIIDAGCGSGILSIAAARLGAKNVLAMDIDGLAARIARENVALNRLNDIIKVEAGDVIEALPTQAADMVLANITADLIIDLIPEAARALTSDGYLFGSGITDSRRADVEKELKAHGFVIEQVLQDGDWIGIAARKD
ncbi:MAG: 50S ribosomal protein L11 methyltransferase [Syntrophomonas sp.]|nr:50S ribosomal protein L11 methyltransferase [Syntrophomonas sp.]